MPSETVDLTVAEDVLKTIHLSQIDNVKTTAEFDEPIKAPIKAGQKVGELKISIADKNSLTVPLVAAKDVEKVGLLGRFWANVKYFVFGAK
jgi:D-alanyl-D-alanine carboxypeptidase (penicillin-binding protein 5/6)